MKTAKKPKYTLDDRPYPRLTAEQIEEMLREWKEDHDRGLLHYKSKGYPSLGEKETIH
jgi:hypothetical protein